jgi:cyclophilin family peptidyl-prolyl cis-trans isomerase
MNTKIISSFFVILIGVALTSHAQKKDYVITIKTKYGDMVAILYDETPKHKANFIKLAKEHYFDSLLFHRVISNFMIQGGDPDSKKALAGQPLGQGGPGYTVEAEFNPKFFHEKGALCAARQGDAGNPTKASSGSQFYIVQGAKLTEDDLRVDRNKFNTALGTFFQNPANKGLKDSLEALHSAGDQVAFRKKLADLVPRVEKELGLKVTRDISPEKIKAYTTVGGTPHLDDTYTVFGKVIKGIDVIDTIAAQPKGLGDRPQEDIRMFVTVEEIAKTKIEKLYGYQYPPTK